MERKNQIFDHLKMLTPALATTFYWIDRHGVIQGMSNLFKEMIGLAVDFNPIGKTVYDLYPRNIADKIVQHNEAALLAGTVGSQEEEIIDNSTKKTKYLNSIKSPFHDEKGEVVGLIDISTDITIETTVKKEEAERQQKTKIFEHLERVASFIPVNMYWFDESYVVLGGNDLALRAIGGKSPKMFIGKKVHEFYQKNIADEIVKNLDEVRKTGKVISKEEMIKDLATEEKRYFNALLAPLRDDNDKIIGIMGVAVEITDRKKAEKMQIKIATQKVRIEEYMKFEEIVKQVAHDICSPLSSLKMYLQLNQNEISERVRVNLIQATDSIKDTADGILAKYKRDSAENLERKDKLRATVISLVLSQAVGEKRYQYQDHPIEFKLNIDSKDNLTSIKTFPLSFNRMFSNIINNAVDAFDDQEGEVNITLKTSKNQAKIIIEDNGKGIPPKVLKKIRKKEAISSGKENGHGIGMAQIQATLRKDGGKMRISSKIGKGTKITLTYPRVEPPEWLAQKIEIQKGDTVVILDDESPIHAAWNKRFQKYRDKIKIKHFTSGEEAIEFINQTKNKDKILLLSDYRLMKQDTNGLKVIESTQIKRSILVTSYHTDHKILDFASLLNVKTLPKSMAAYVPINII